MDDKGLYGKYFVLKGEGDGSPDAEVALLDATGRALVFKAYQKKTWCFVLSPEKKDDYGMASRVALAAYAYAIRERNPKLADDLIEKLAKCEE
jgi:uncharacterized caspase-like protein